MIVSFRCVATEQVYQGNSPPDLPADIQKVALRKLQQLQIATRLDDLRRPPGNRLEPLQGDRTGQHSIRINVKFRLCFIWTARGAEAVEILDYH